MTQMGSASMIGVAIQQYRQQQGLTLEYLVRKICVDNAAVRAWEAGIADPSAHELLALCVILRTSPNDLLNFAWVLSSITHGDASYRQESPWDDYDDGGGFDDDEALMGKASTFADRISDAGFRELLGFPNTRTGS